MGYELRILAQRHWHVLHIKEGTKKYNEQRGWTAYI